MGTLVTSGLFKAYLACETKANLVSTGIPISDKEIPNWRGARLARYVQSAVVSLRSTFLPEECHFGKPTTDQLRQRQFKLVVGCLFGSGQLESQTDALHLLSTKAEGGGTFYIPVRCVPTEHVTYNDRLLLAFDALALSTLVGVPPPFGRIVYGRNYRSATVMLSALLGKARAVVTRITRQVEGSTEPALQLNRHCPECEFKTRCRDLALRTDDLSLLTNMSATEQQSQHAKGIFSVRQLSFTFRPRRPNRRFSKRGVKYYHPLKALAVREDKIYISGRPQLPTTGTPAYLDVEGDPDRAFYYLIGLRTPTTDKSVQYSFWANAPSDEKQLWFTFLDAMSHISSPQLIYYGSYEKTFLARMRARYGDGGHPQAWVDQLLKNAVNLLSYIYAQFYFPTYSNGLKDIARYLGFHWSETDASGLHAMMWRSEWEDSGAGAIKDRLHLYNAQDCEALELLDTAIGKICQQSDDPSPQNNSVVHVDTLKREYPQRFGHPEFLVPGFDVINKCAYWDYQRTKVYVRSREQINRASRSRKGRVSTSVRVNKVVVAEEPRPTECPDCGGGPIHKAGKARNVVLDLAIGGSSAKRWVVERVATKFICGKCHSSFHRAPAKPELRAYALYQIIELHVPQNTVTRAINELFHLNLPRSAVNRFKEDAAELYQTAYGELRRRIVQGSLVHADESMIWIEGKQAVVWVFTSLDEVLYVCSASRGADVLKEYLDGFRGVLVSDFYSAYDSIACRHQKCLIHLMRDLNGDLAKLPFNDELKELACAFAELLQPVVKTIDRFGLKAYHLRKHKVFVDQFFRRIARTCYRTEVARAYAERFQKNRDSLFTFLDCDGVPWNNNNAEHAVKAFALLRNVIRGNGTEKGLKEYLVLLSLCETCRCKGVSFWEFLRSGDATIL